MPRADKFLKEVSAGRAFSSIRTHPKVLSSEIKMHAPARQETRWRLLFMTVEIVVRQGLKGS